MDTSATIDRALQLMSQKAYPDCIGLLQEGIAESPRNVDLYLYLAYVYAKQDLVDECIDVLEKAVDVAPASAKVHYNLGVAYQKRHNITEAKDEFLRALGLDATYAAPKQALDFITRIHVEEADSDEEEAESVTAQQS
jgi:Tfp pilus assembly protein PilF